MSKKTQTAETPEAHALAVLHEADQLFSAAELAAAYERLAAEIGARLKGDNPLVLCVMIGGMVPTVEILRRLEWPYEVDYLHATRYRGETSGSEIVWKVSPSTKLEGRTVLIIDDILDEGHTLAEIQKAVRAQGVARLYTAVLAEKRHARRNPEAQADFIGLAVPDRYVFGGGMDYRNFLRFAPGLYAVKGL
jgi:hypoxanthine phosphoribosyltransferase